MDGGERVGRRRGLKERLGLNGFGCCGAHWGFGPISPLNDEESPQQDPTIPTRNPAETSSTPNCDGRSPPTAAVTGINLATALAIERQLRATQDLDSGESPTGPELSRPNSGPIVGTPLATPSRMSLMSLLHETDVEDLEKETKEVGAGLGSDMVCCVCMGRKKGAAFIPCGHTFCRVCSRELWLNRGSCPLCNRPILEILDIF